MTVAKLIKKLKAMPKDAEVWFTDPVSRGSHAGVETVELVLEGSCLRGETVPAHMTYVSLC